MGKVATEATLREGVEVLKSIAANGLPRLLTFTGLKRAIRAGYAKVFFDVGDQIITDYAAQDGRPTPPRGT